MPRAAACPCRAAALSASLKACSWSTIPDARRERRSARRASRAGGASPLAASAPPEPRSRLHRSKSAICSASPRRATSSTAAASSFAAAAASEKARRRWVLPLPLGPQRKTKRSPSSSASRSAFSAAPFFPGEKLSSVGGGGGASSSRSCCINPCRSRRAAGISIKIRGRRHVTLSATSSLDQQEADHLPRRRGGYRRGGRASRGYQAFRKEDAAPGSARRNRRIRRARGDPEEISRARARLRNRRRRHQVEARVRAAAARHGGHRSRGDERQRHSRLRRGTAVLPRLLRVRKARRARCDGSRQGNRAGLRAGRLRADRRRDGRASERFSQGPIRSRRIRARRGGERPNRRRAFDPAGRRDPRACGQRPAFQRLFADPQDSGARQAAARDRPSGAHAHLRQARSQASGFGARQGPGSHHGWRSGRQCAPHSSGKDPSGHRAGLLAAAHGVRVAAARRPGRRSRDAPRVQLRHRHGGRGRGGARRCGDAHAVGRRGNRVPHRPRRSAQRRRAAGLDRLKMEKRTERAIQVVAGTALAIGCLMVLRPFLAALLSAAILCFSTWPLYRLIERRLGGRRTLAALAMTLLMILVLVLPLALIAGSYVDDVPQLLERLRETLAQGLPRPPGWVASIPLVGESLDSGWREIAGSKAALAEALKRIAQPARAVLVQAGIIVGEGVLQFTLIAFIGFFFYRDGAALAQALRNGLDRVAGDAAGRLLEIVGGTINGVMVGIVGTGLAQGLAAVIGFLIAGVPGALMLGFITAILSIIPAGPL